MKSATQDKHWPTKDRYWPDRTDFGHPWPDETDFDPRPDRCPDHRPEGTDPMLVFFPLTFPERSQIVTLGPGAHYVTLMKSLRKTALNEKRVREIFSKIFKVTLV